MLNLTVLDHARGSVITLTTAGLPEAAARSRAGRMSLRIPSATAAPKTVLMTRIMALSESAIKQAAHFFSVFPRAFFCLADAVQREAKQSHVYTQT